MSNGVCVDIAIGLLIGAKLLLSTEAYDLFLERRIGRLLQYCSFLEK